MKEKHIPNFEAPMGGMTWLQPKQCKDCVYRDKTTLTLDGETREVGWSKDTCHVYVYPECKPNLVMDNRVECPNYEKEEAWNKLEP